MWRNTMARRATLASVLAIAVSVPLAGGAGAAGVQGKDQVFGADSTNITNPYLPISKFHRTVLKGNDQGQHLRIVRTLLDRTKTFHYKGQKVEAAVVRDRDTDVAAGTLIEKTIDYFAQDKAGTVYYFGEDVNEYQHGQPIGHDGSWRLGRDTKRAGVLMPARPKLGDTFVSEAVPNITVEKDKIAAKGKTQRIAGHTYHHVMRIREHATTPKPGDFEFKTYAPGTGVITEANGGLHLTSSN